MLSDKNIEVLTNIIGAVETGGQIYGKRRYDDYTQPYKNSPLEHTITLGWAQNYGYEARKLIQMIKDTAPATFKSIDKDGSIAEMLGRDWVAICWDPSATQKATLIKLIDSDAGHKAQDELFAQLAKSYITKCEQTWTADVAAVMMYCEIAHLGGIKAADRIFKRCGGKFDLDSIMASLKKDQGDKSSDNQVGDKKYWTRHVKCVEFIKKYADLKNVTLSTIVDEFTKYIGVHEYDGIVATIQRWYYGYLVKDAWCATSTSYFANKVGILSQLGGKNEGVSEMMAATRKLHKKDGRFWEYPKLPDVIKRHDIIFFKRNGSSHVAHCWKDTEYKGIGSINVIGGNQSDMICRKDYAQMNIQAVYRPYYETGGGGYMFELKTIRIGDKGAEVRLLQRVLRGMGYMISSGKLIGTTGQFGKETEKCVKELQRKNKLEVDGIVGKATWAKVIGV